MRSPRAKLGVGPIEVQAPSTLVPIPASAPVTEEEAIAIVTAIRPRFTEFASQYDFRKYPVEVYDDVLQKFREPERVDADTLRRAILWKYGHLGKKRIPSAHEQLIAELQESWPSLAPQVTSEPKHAFGCIDEKIGRGKRFITVAFLVHLLFQDVVPIVDQHNFRAVNALIAAVRPSWKTRASPRAYLHVTLVTEFMASVLNAWSQQHLESVPSTRELDNFLMMYGKAIKSLSRSSPRQSG